MKLISISALLIFSSFVCFGQEFPSRPRAEQRIIDAADLLSDLEEQQLQETVWDYEQKTSVQMLIMTVRSTGGIEGLDYATLAGNHYGVGQVDENNGVVLLINMAEKGLSRRQVVLATGKGLEYYLSDDRATEITKNVMAPFLKQKQYYQGLKDGVQATIQELGYQTMKEREEERAAARKQKTMIIWIVVIVIVLLLILAFISYYRKRMKQVKAMQKQTGELKEYLSDITRENTGYWEPLIDFLPKWAMTLSQEQIGKLSTEVFETFDEIAIIDKKKSSIQLLILRDLEEEMLSLEKAKEEVMKTEESIKALHKEVKHYEDNADKNVKKAMDDLEAFAQLCEDMDKSGNFKMVKVLDDRNGFQKRCDQLQAMPQEHETYRAVYLTGETLSQEILAYRDQLLVWQEWREIVLNETKDLDEMFEGLLKLESKEITESIATLSEISTEEVFNGYLSTFHQKKEYLTPIGQRQDEIEKLGHQKEWEQAHGVLSECFSAVSNARRAVEDLQESAVKQVEAKGNFEHVVNNTISAIKSMTSAIDHSDVNTSTKQDAKRVVDTMAEENKKSAAAKQDWVALVEAYKAIAQKANNVSSEAAADIRKARKRREAAAAAAAAAAASSSSSSSSSSDYGGGSFGGGGGSSDF